MPVHPEMGGNKNFCMRQADAPEANFNVYSYTKRHAIERVRFMMRGNRMPLKRNHQKQVLSSG